MRGVRQFLLYACVGLLNTLVHFGIFELLLRVGSVPVLAASSLGYAAGVANSYVLNRVWTFTVTTRANTMEFGRFALVNIVSLLLNLAVLRQLTLRGLTPEFSQALAILASLSANFAGSKWWAFRARA